MEDDGELEMIRRRMMEDITTRMKGGAAPGAQPVAAATPTNLSDMSFDEFIKRNQVAFVDFWAPWCGPCRMVAPVVEKLASELRGKVAFGKLNVDDNPVKSAEFNIMSIPTMMIFYGGKPADMIVGAVPRAEILSRLGRYIKNT